MVMVVIMMMVLIDVTPTLSWTTHRATHEAVSSGQPGQPEKDVHCRRREWRTDCESARTRGASKLPMQMGDTQVCRSASSPTGAARQGRP
mmetsp:Transcript_118598/g.193069  ORF Transcript_118598/g.193069 Transcript_118598/m.193069 type:complete len:90 (+) Transcript_118598:2-271(+)